jgi:hypothetical protein
VELITSGINRFPISVLEEGSWTPYQVAFGIPPKEKPLTSNLIRQMYSASINDKDFTGYGYCFSFKRTCRGWGDNEFFRADIRIIISRAKTVRKNTGWQEDEHGVKKSDKQIKRQSSLMCKQIASLTHANSLVNDLATNFPFLDSTSTIRYSSIRSIGKSNAINSIVIAKMLTVNICILFTLEMCRTRQIIWLRFFGSFTPV